MFWIYVVGAGVACFVAVIWIAIFVALAMDRGTTARKPTSDNIDWDADQQAPSIVAGAFGKARHR